MRIAPNWQYAVVNGAAYTEFTAHLLSDRFTFENRMSFSRPGIVAASSRSIAQDVCSSPGAEGVLICMAAWRAKLIEQDLKQPWKESSGSLVAIVRDMAFQDLKCAGRSLGLDGWV
jgi:hypothetical protein